MAKSLTIDHKRMDSFFVNPKDLLADPENRGRKFPPVKEAVQQLAISILENGQEQPIQVTAQGRGSATVYSVVYGFTRHEAALMIVNGFTVDGKKYHDPNFLIRCDVVRVNDKDAFKANVVENAHRFNLSDIDHAFNMRKAMQKYGYSQADCAREWRKTEITVSHLLRLLEFDDSTQELIHYGRLSRSAAIQIQKLPQDQWSKAIKAAMKENGKVDSSELMAMVRAGSVEGGSDGGTSRNRAPSRNRAAAGGAGGDAGTSRNRIPLTKADMVKSIHTEIESADAGPKAKELAEAMLAWSSGERLTPWFWRKVGELVGDE